MKTPTKYSKLVKNNEVDKELIGHVAFLQSINVLRIIVTKETNIDIQIIDTLIHACRVMKKK
ncbi:hypothetical protein [Enterococcus canis]|uniref:hypothetical protein n=1 Tax=Enterococcus canis TaxID=214095 RepID=UPI0008331C19|nr:hypothetical protein [Enterococcus canis]